MLALQRARRERARSQSLRCATMRTSPPPSQLAREFFAYMRATYPERAAAIDAYLIAQDFEGQLADFRAHFNPPRGECLLARLDGAPVGIVMLKPYADGRLRAEPHVCRPRRPRPRRRPPALRDAARPRPRARLSRGPARRAERAGRGAAALPRARLRPRPRPARLHPRRPRAWCRCAWRSEIPQPPKVRPCPPASPASPTPTCTARPPATGCGSPTPTSSSRSSAT